MHETTTGRAAPLRLTTMGVGKNSLQILTHEADNASLAVAVVTAIWLYTKPF